MVREEEGVEKEGDGVGKEKSAGGSRGKSAFCFSEAGEGVEKEEGGGRGGGRGELRAAGFLW